MSTVPAASAAVNPASYGFGFGAIVGPIRVIGESVAASGAVLFTLEHEVRAMTHPLYARRLINRNPEQTNASFASGHEDWPPVAPTDL